VAGGAGGTGVWLDTGNAVGGTTRVVAVACITDTPVGAGAGVDGAGVASGSVAEGGTYSARGTADAVGVVAGFATLRLPVDNMRILAQAARARIGSKIAKVRVCTRRIEMP
jgi:hypothetical protein